MSSDKGGEGGAGRNGRKRKVEDQEEEPMESGEEEDAGNRSSEDLFAEDEEVANDDAGRADETDAGASASAESTKITFKGIPVAYLKTSHKMRPPDPADVRQTIIVRWPMAGKPEPFPRQRVDKWDDAHVKMPFSDENLFPVENKKGKGRTLEKRWKLVTAALKHSAIKSSNDLENAIASYNRRERMSFDLLHKAFEDTFEEEESAYFFDNVLPLIVGLCLEGASTLTKPIPLLRHGTNRMVTLSQRQVASILANAFFCTFPRRNSSGKRTEYSEFPEINFNRLFANKTDKNVEKLKCLINYFRRVAAKKDSDISLVTYERKFVPASSMPKWDESCKALPKLHVDSRGTIEDDGFGMLQVDFANRFIGGGVIGGGCVQEEIRFIISPELIASRLFTEKLDSNECVVITGFERFSKYKGYASTFEFDGSYEDETPVDPNSMHRGVRLVAIDALRFTSAKEQYRWANIIRELNKAYVGFRNSDPTDKGAVATGNWGCGAFHGNPQLKSLIQLMAAAEAGRDVAYFTFGDDQLRDDIFDVWTFLTEKGVTVGGLFEVLCKYQSMYNPQYSVFEHVKATLTSYDMDTDDEMEGGDENHDGGTPADDKSGDKASPRKEKDNGGADTARDNFRPAEEDEEGPIGLFAMETDTATAAEVAEAAENDEGGVEKKTGMKQTRIPEFTKKKR